MSRDNPGTTRPAAVRSRKYGIARRNLAIELWEITAMSVDEIAEFLQVSPRRIRIYLGDAR